LFVGLWTQADREGRLEDRPRKIKVAILPYDDYDINESLDRLQSKEFIFRYSANGANYIQINNFLKHQYPNIKESESTIPAPCKNRTSTPRLRKGKEGKGKEGKGKEIGEVSFTEIITDLNEKTSKNYKLTKATKELINARISEGFTLEDFKKVHTNMSAKWKHDPKMNQYLRPTTLYAISKFEGYVNAGVSLSDKGIISEKTEKGMQVMKDFIGGVNAQ